MEHPIDMKKLIPILERQGMTTDDLVEKVLEFARIFEHTGFENVDIMYILTVATALKVDISELLD